MDRWEQAVYSRIAACVGAGPDTKYGDNIALEQIGVDSLQFILLILELEEELGVKVFDKDNVAGISTVGDILQLFRRAMLGEQALDKERCV